ncbi:MAG: type IV toxin-antitoxin system AbiEi family antitoxin domain-containing protein [candidate division NC10 bacterium]
MRGTSKSNKDKVIDLMRGKGVLRTKDLDRHKIPRETLRRLVKRGQIARVGHGLYMLPDTQITEHHSLAEACKRIPHGVICLLSALRFHELTTQNPFEIWMAINQKAWRPRAVGPPVRAVHLSGAALKEGVEEHLIEGVTVKVYSPAKTVADCFKFRNKVGLDVALEALRDYRRKYRAELGELWRFARICRVAKVIRPYLEALS